VSVQPFEQQVSEPAYLPFAVPGDSWRALGTYVDLRVADPTAAVEAGAFARAVLDEVDRACSRFRPDSDLVRANTHAGAWVPVSPILVGAVRVALEAAEVTAGLVDPCLGEIVRRIGYDRSFEMLTPSSDPVGVPVPAIPGRWRDLEVGDGQVRVPRGAALDLGATGKAYAADLVAASVVDRFDTPVVVSVGGDVRAAAPDGPSAGWPVAIASTKAELDDGPGPVATLTLTDGGLATSSTSARRWVRGSRVWHHVVDPRTGASAAPTWRSVTAFGRTAVAANTASTAAIVLGEDAQSWLTAHDVAALLVDAGCRVHRSTRWTLDVQEDR
jgi:thiamine biosynthesis lipoprotein